MIFMNAPQIMLTVDALERERGSPTPDNLENLPLDARYVGLLLELDQLEKSSGSSDRAPRVGAHLLTATVSRTDRLNQVNRKLKVLKLIADIEVLDGRERWRLQPTSAEFESAFGILCQHQMERLQRKTAKEVQTLMLTIALRDKQRNVGRGASKKLISARIAQGKKVEVAMEAWDEWRRASTSEVVPFKDLKDLIQDARKGIYPWEGTANEGTSSYFCKLVHSLRIGFAP